MTSTTAENLRREIAKFRSWAVAEFGKEPTDGGEWECNYDGWPPLHAAVLDFVESAGSVTSWSKEDLAAVLYAIARDNEIEHLTRELRTSSRPAIIYELTAAAIEEAERDTKWQLAEAIGRMTDKDPRAEPLLEKLAHDEDEYVRRRSLSALARIGSSLTERLALETWDRPDLDQEHARMMVLWCLLRIQSPHLESKLQEAEADPRQYLQAYAAKVRRREVDT
jgi:HEAT repeat protein